MVENKVALLERTVLGLQRFSKKLGITPVKELLCMLAAPRGCSTFLSHEELGMPYIEDKIKLALLLLRRAIWPRKSTPLNRSVINDYLPMT
ncbi:hypothetical protein NDU88_008550 [Pleurodeles waltl]|uniref:Uncharacterized protein n=1 Tax=Pleurodeles waltl TaxID=8319 RepID=A0AAV7PSI0_PLEWA|nr:hypothetical protein NDU88_008550 [Pleurodeles waltl]